jgi:hypothetical protein
MEDKIGAKDEIFMELNGVPVGRPKEMVDWCLSYHHVPDRESFPGGGVAPPNPDSPEKE